jgi:AcrR family transcriptional regulator
MDGRAKRRIEAMRRIQAAALDLFEARGYDQVTVEEIAAAAEVGPATVYRGFGGKERIVLWDEYDPMIFDALAARLPGRPVGEAMLEALIESLDRVYAEDRARILRRARLILAQPAIAAGAAAGHAELRRGLAAVLRGTGAVRGELEADVIAAALAGALAAAVEHWVRGDGRVALRHALRRALRSLALLGGA